MKFDRFKFTLAWNWFYLFPTIAIVSNNSIYFEKDFSIGLHWLCWHFQWRWVEDNDMRFRLY